MAGNCGISSRRSKRPCQFSSTFALPKHFIAIDDEKESEYALNHVPCANTKRFPPHASCQEFCAIVGLAQSGRCTAGCQPGSGHRVTIGIVSNRSTCCCYPK